MENGVGLMGGGRTISQGEVDPGSILNNLIYATSPTTTIFYYLKPRKISEDLRQESLNCSPAVDVDYQR